MSVFSRNPFDLLGEDGAPAQAPAPKPAAAASTPAAAKPAAREVPGSKTPAGNANRGGAAAAGGRSGYPARGGARNVLKTNDEPRAVDPEQGFEGERREPRGDRGGRGPRGHGEGRGRGRATRTPRGRGAYAGGPVSGREARPDRRSANAHTDSEKKVHQGWGADEGSAELKAEVEGEADATKEAAAPQTPAEPADVKEGEQAPAAAAAAPVEEEDNTKSLEEYLAERAALTAGFSKLELRKVEGTDEFVGQALKKSGEPDEAFFAGKPKEKTAAEKAKTKKEKVFLEFEGRFAPPSSGDRPERRGGDDRGGRGRGGARGSSRGARGGARGGATATRGGAAQRSSAREANIAVDDAKAFPALGA